MSSSRDFEKEKMALFYHLNFSNISKQQFDILFTSRLEQTIRRDVNEDLYRTYSLNNKPWPDHVQSAQTSLVRKPRILYTAK